MRRALQILMAGSLIGGATLLTACGDDDAATGVEITDAWARATAEMAEMGAVYFTAESSEGDAIVAASVSEDIAASAEIHQSTVGGAETTAMEHDDGADMEHDMATMREVESVDLPAGEAVELAPGGYHVMLIGLVAPLEEGDTFDLTVELENAEPVTVEVEVRR
jgi:copper(I)-binding protein